MPQRALVNTDGEILLVLQQGHIMSTTELGTPDVKPGEVALVPRGIAFSEALPDGASHGYVCENYGDFFRLPEFGPVGSNGLAHIRVRYEKYSDLQQFNLYCWLVHFASRQ